MGHRMTVDIDEPVWRKLERVAAHNKTQVSTIVRQALDALVDRWERRWAKQESTAVDRR